MRLRHSIFSAIWSAFHSRWRMLPVLPLIAIVLLISVAFMWLVRQGQGHSSDKSVPAADATKNVDKLRGFHGLAMVVTCYLDMFVDTAYAKLCLDVTRFQKHRAWCVVGLASFLCAR